MEIDVERLKKVTLGLNLRLARNNLRTLYPSLNPVVEYQESDRDKYSVIGFRFNKVTQKFTFVVASDNPIYDLPMLYQENEFLKRFMMIFQSVHNETDYLLDNLDLYFRPTETPVAFLPTLISWFGVNLKLLQGNEKIIRKVLQYAVPLYKIRGTIRGLKFYLYLISGTMPEIIESTKNFKDFRNTHDVEIDMAMFSDADLSNVFYVYFPCLETDLEEDIVETVHNVVQSEKPSYTQGFIVFKKKAEKKRNITSFIDEDDEVVSQDMIAQEDTIANDLDESNQKSNPEPATTQPSAKKRASKRKPPAKSGSAKADGKANISKQPTKKMDFDDSIMDF